MVYMATFYVSLEHVISNSQKRLQFLNVQISIAYKTSVQSLKHLTWSSLWAEKSTSLELRSSGLSVNAHWLHCKPRKYSKLNTVSSQLFHCASECGTVSTETQNEGCDRSDYAPTVWTHTPDHQESYFSGLTWEQWRMSFVRHSSALRRSRKWLTSSSGGNTSLQICCTAQPIPSHRAVSAHTVQSWGYFVEKLLSHWGTYKYLQVK